MKLPALIVTDLHLVDDPACQYRWDLFPWLYETCKEERVKTVLILGDLTDAKDNHSAELTNRVVAAISGIPADVVILTGNHDWLKAGQVFFKFLNRLPNVTVITEPTEDQDPSGPLAYFLPYSKNPAKDWKDFDFSHYDYLFMHQTISGAIASNGQEMEGDSMPPLNAKKVYSGDIHVPQIIKGVEYVGSPYHVHFGDSFKPRAVLIEKNRTAVDLHFKTIKRMTIKVGGLPELRRKRFEAGDQIKLRIELAESDKHDWSKIRREATEILKDAGVVVAGTELLVKKANPRATTVVVRQALNPADAVLRFVEAEELGGDVLDAALEILEAG